MPGYHRTKSKEDSTGVLTFIQDAWGGGENSDLPASAVAKDEVPLLQDLVAFPEYLEGHGGSQLYSATTLPGSGTVRSHRQHPTSKKILLHRGTQLWLTDSAMTAWAEVKSYAYDNNSVTVNGDAASQLPVVRMVGANASNTNNGTTYWELTDTAGTRTLNVYKDVAKTQLVATGSVVGDGLINLRQQNNSGLRVAAPVSYTTNDVDAANTFVTSINYSFGTDDVSTIRPFESNFIVFIKRGVSSTRPVLVNLADGCFQKLSNTGSASLGAGYGYTPLVGSGTESGGTPYGYRYIFTYCRIVDSSGVPAYSSSRVTATLVNESAANAAKNQAGTDFLSDYGEYWLADPIAAGTPHTIYPTQLGIADSARLAWNADEHWTHIGLYRVLNIGATGIDPVSGEGNNREVYTWCGDFDITLDTWSVTKTDDELRNLYAAGFGLRTRGWQEMPVGEVGEVTAGFLYMGARGESKVNYGQLGAKELVGYHHPVWQVIRLDDALQAIGKSTDLVSFICSGKCWSSSPNVYKDVGVLQSVFQLRHLMPIDGPIGVTDWSSFTEIEKGTFIAHCSDHTIRTWNGVGWSKDLASRKVKKLIRTVLDGSVGAFVDGVFLLWYRNSSSPAYNDKCLRFGFNEDTGLGWSRLARATWVRTPLRCGGLLIQDANNVQRLLALDYTDGLYYWVETFDSFEGSSLAKVWKDKVAVDGSGGTDIASTVKFRERVGSKESNTLTHQETHVHLRPVDEDAGYLSGFQVSLTGYVNGSPTAVETLANAPKTGDLSFGKEHRGRRLQSALSFTTSKFQLVSVESRDLEDERKALGQGYGDTDEAGYQRVLGSTLKHWLTRPSATMNRARASAYSLAAGAAPSLVTGPDGKSYALSFADGLYQQADTTLYGDFSFCIWVKGVELNKRVFSTVAAAFLHARFTSETEITITDTGFGSVAATAASIASGWHNFWVTRAGTALSIYQNGALLGGTGSWTAADVGGTSMQLNPQQGAMQLYDFRALTTALSAAAIAYYYDDVINNAGRKVLP